MGKCDSPRRSQRIFEREQAKPVDGRIKEILDLSEDTWLGLKKVEIEGKGWGVVAAKNISKGECVLEYAGDLLDYKKAKEKEDEYGMDKAQGCYMYYFIAKVYTF